MSTETIGPSELRAIVEAFVEGLSRHQQAINALNVFPVPDGDTGTNMLATARSVLVELDELEVASNDLRSVCAAIGRGSLMGARGNSGVILCQVLRAIADELSSHDEPGAGDLAGAFSKAAAAARSAVLKPVEGTILTVADASAKSVSVLGSHPSLAEVVRAARDGAVEALASTPELLSVLKDAGVVDAGGTGLVLLFDAFCHVLADDLLFVELPIPESVASILKSADFSSTALDVHASAEGPRAYEVMFLLDAPDESLDHLKARWAELGDSIVVVGGGGLWNCHIHTFDIGPAIEAAIEIGRPHEIRVSDLTEQIVEQDWVRAAGTGAVKDVLELASVGEPVTSVIAVASGGGVSQIFSSLGVEAVVAGGQSMNPSTREILALVDRSRGRDVVILPNNTNIVPVAVAVSELAEKNVFVVPTPGVQEGFAALLEYDPQADGADNESRMSLAAKRVVAGEVTRAVRDAPSPIGPIKKDQWIGISRGGIESVGDDLAEAARGLLDRLVSPAHELVTVIVGQGCDPQVRAEIAEHLSATWPGVEVECLEGGQPLYPLLFSLE